MSPADQQSSDSDEVTIQQLRREIEGLQAELGYRQQAEARVAGILTAALDAIICMDHRGRIVEWNPAAERMFGYSHVEAVGQELAELIIPERLRDQHRRGLDRYLNTGDSSVLGTRVETHAIDRNGTEFPVELGITRIVNDLPPLFTGHIRNLSQIHRLVFEQQFLGEASKLLSSSLDVQSTMDQVAQIPVSELANWCIVYLADDSSKQLVRKAIAYDDPDLQHVGQVMLHTAQLDPEARVGVPYVGRTGNSVLYSNVTPEVFSSDVEHPEELIHLMRDLELRSWMCVPLIARGGILGAMSFITTKAGRSYDERDVRVAEDLGHRAGLAIENARLYEQTQRTVQARDDFLSMASHELKTPLSILKGNMQMLRRQLEQSGGSSRSTNDLFADMESRLGRIETLIGDLLDVTRIQRGRLQLSPEKTDLLEVARSVIARFERFPSRAEHPVLSLDVPDHPVTGLWDPGRLDQVLTTLVSNAVEHSPQDGEVRISVEQLSGMVTIVVQDEGFGIAEDDQARIFEPFCQNDDGSGPAASVKLGLYICREIVRQHGGAMSLESSVGHGSTFSVSLPLQFPSVDAPSRDDTARIN